MLYISQCIACSDHLLVSVACRKHVVGQVKDVVPHRVVGIKKCLNVPPGVLECVRMSASRHINKTDRVI
jgi:hypothetical protein